MVFADLHTHTTKSDGNTEPENVVSVAKEHGVKAIAVTDHDVVHEGKTPIEHRSEVDVINGIELRVDPENCADRIDLLGYGVIPSKRLSHVLRQLQKNRVRRADAMLDLIEDETGVRVTTEEHENIGRGHIAQAIAECDDLEYTYEEAFNELIGTDCPCYRQRDIPSFEYGVELLRETCEFISLAHPYRYEKSAEDALKLAQHLDGVEVEYPYERKQKHGLSPRRDDNISNVAAEWFDLTITGGSDAHRKHETGQKGLTKQQYEKFLEQSNLKYYSGHF